MPKWIIATIQWQTPHCDDSQKSKVCADFYYLCSIFLTEQKISVVFFATTCVEVENSQASNTAFVLTDNAKNLNVHAA